LKGDALDRTVERKSAFISVGACHRRDRIAADFEGLQTAAAEADTLDLAVAGRLAIHEQAQRAAALELRAAISLSRLWLAQDQPAAAHALLARCYSWFSEGLDTADLQTAKSLLARCQTVT
jgi:hypothetical protein